MLNRISIKNLALISETELEFSDKLTVLSGETGAGKSIIVDALMLLMGGKYDKTMLSYGTESGYVEGLFSFADGEANSALEEAGLPFDEEIIVRRSFNAGGKNDIRVNGRSITVRMLKTLMSNFVDICGQNEYQILTDKKKHIVILDNFAGKSVINLKNSIAEKYNELCDVKRKIASIGDTAMRLARIDLLSFQVDEIERAKVKKDEENELLDYRNKAVHSEKIRMSIDSSLDALSRDGGASDKIYEAIRRLSAITTLMPEVNSLHERLSSVSVELDDIIETLNQLSSTVEYDEGEMENIESRLKLLRNLKSKYGNLNDISEKLNAIKEELRILNNSDEEYEQLCKRKERLLDELFIETKELSDIRRNKAIELELAVKNELTTLGMANSQYKVAFNDFPTRSELENIVTANGVDDVEFMLSPNPGQPLLPLLKIISGGEMSRFMLALKVVASKSGSVGTMIFDEIDTGISGKIGQEVAKKLAEISRNAQVLCVTHLAPIASMADYQYFIEKSTDGKTTRTNVRSLNYKEMIDEVCRLSGGRDVSEASVKAAEEMKKWSDNYKQNL